MTSQPATHENIVIITTNGVNFPQTEKPTPSDPKQDNLWKHLKSNIRSIGSIQIMCGVTVLSLGVMLVFAPFFPHFSETFSPLLKSAHPFLGALCFIISGSLSIIADQKTTKIWVQCSLATNIMSSLSALVGSIILSISLAALGSVSSKCASTEKNELENALYYYREATDYCPMNKVILAGTLSVILICTLLELGLAALTAKFWWKQSQFVFPGSVHFMPQSTKNTFLSKARFESSYEELIT